MQRRAPIDGQKLSDQVKDRLADKPIIKKSGKLVSTGSTLLDLAISGGTYDEGGLPGGILVEIFGPSG